MTCKYKLQHFAVIIAVMILGVQFSYCTYDLDKAISEENSHSDFPAFSVGQACKEDRSECIDALIVNSGIGKTIIDSINTMVREMKDIGVKTVCFNSNGGDVHASLDVIKWLEDNNINTCIADVYISKDKVLIPTRCASACSSILLGGKERIRLGKSTPVIIHSAGIPRINSCLCIDNVGKVFNHITALMMYGVERLVIADGKYDTFKQLYAIKDDVPFTESYKLSLEEELETGLINKFIL